MYFSKAAQRTIALEYGVLLLGSSPSGGPATYRSEDRRAPQLAMPKATTASGCRRRCGRAKRRLRGRKQSERASAGSAAVPRIHRQSSPGSGATRRKSAKLRSSRQSEGRQRASGPCVAGMRVCRQTAGISSLVKQSTKVERRKSSAPIARCVPPPGLAPWPRSKFVCPLPGQTPRHANRLPASMTRRSHGRSAGIAAPHRPHDANPRARSNHQGLASDKACLTTLRFLRYFRNYWIKSSGHGVFFFDYR